MGTGLNEVPTEQATPMSPFPVTVEYASDFGLVAFWMEMPPKAAVP